MSTDSRADLGTFYKAHPEFLVGPALLTAVVQFVTRTPRASQWLSANGWSSYGVVDTMYYMGFAITLAYATHAWFMVHISQKRQLQDYDSKASRVQGSKPTNAAQRGAPPEAAVRTVAALLSSFVYASIPFAPATSSWPMFIAWTAAFAVYWDAHFFLVHKTVHEQPMLYKWIHKLHHSHKQPGVFSAYFVTYQSHFLTEQSVVLIGAFLGLPRDVFTWTMWWGTLGTYIEHCGHDVDDIKLSPLPITFGQLATVLSPWSLVLGGESAAHHDWHHEKFFDNYALSFTYLDKIFGSHHDGRIPGAAVDPKTREYSKYSKSYCEDIGPTTTTLAELAQDARANTTIGKEEKKYS